MSPTEVEANGWTAVSVSAKEIKDSVGQLGATQTYTVQDIIFPFEDKLVSEAQAFVKARLSPEAYNHSMRVFYWGKNIIGV
ncbi:Ff.00g134170.m01.CDS01 [Fusarium sp. VM40]|nr:Ff.00g134170.m01.CDS01 [Fusarium sp. VM40]